MLSRFGRSHRVPTVTIGPRATLISFETVSDVFAGDGGSYSQAAEGGGRPHERENETSYEGVKQNQPKWGICQSSINTYSGVDFWFNKLVLKQRKKEMKEREKKGTEETKKERIEGREERRKEKL